MVDQQTVILGIVLVLFATVVFHFGVVFQKLGLTQSKEITFDKGLKGIILAFLEIIKNKWWLIGAILGIVGWFPFVISISLVGFMVTEPINSIGIIIVVIAANRILREPIAWYEFLAILVLIISPLFIAFAGISNVTVDLYAMVVPLLIFLTIAFSITILCFILSQKKRGSKLESFYIMLTGSFLLAIGGVFTNIMAQAITQANIPLTWYFWAEIAFGIFWGSYYHLWVFIGWWGLVICNISSFAFYQSGFQKSRIAIAFPILDSIGLAIPIIAGIFVFNQTFNNYVLFFIGIGLIFIGTSALGRFQVKIRTMKKKNHPQKSTDTIE